MCLPDTDRATLDLLQQPTLKRPTAFRAMRVNAAPFTLQRAAGLQQQFSVTLIGVLNLQPYDFQCGTFVAAGQFHVGKQ
ncbi:MAG TPA: hypothetical protein VK530_09440 [Candidatus Acidoferrum sp.]|nr:hypothetical protein [Candidatus Acidoferrum sp.]